MPVNKLKVLIFIDWYLPAYKAGGPIQSISNLVDRLEHEIDFSIITSNTDLGEVLEIPEENLNRWTPKSAHRVMYLDKNHQNTKQYNEIFLENNYDVAYFNSLFSFKFTVLPFWMLKKKNITKIIAPRGMLGAGALAIKKNKKKLFLQVLKTLNLHQKAIWHATAENEVTELKHHFGENIGIKLAPNLSAKMTDYNGLKKKSVDFVNIFFLSRVSIKKNLMGALKMLSNVDEKLKFNFTIIGPVEDTDYWLNCQDFIDKMPSNIAVIYKGSVPHHLISSELQNQHFMLLPTFHENFGHVIMESWQNGCPVIISNNTPWENLESQNLGYNIPLENKDRFTEVLDFVCRMNQKDYELLSSSSYNYAKKFSENPKVIKQNRSLFLKDNRHT